MNPQPNWTELQEYYSASYQPYDPMHSSEADDDHETDAARRSGKIRHISLPDGMRLLDVGCGGGRFLRIAKKLGAIEQGVEPSKYAADVAQRQGLRIFNGTLESFASQAPEATKFDIITANHVLEHVPAPVDTLRTMRGLLAPGGFVWIAVPNAAYPICRALKGYWYSSDLPYHLMQFTPASLAKAGALAGLKARRQTTESIPRIVAASMRQYLRCNWYVPNRITKNIGLIDIVAKSYARYCDSNTGGEAILTEFSAE